MSKIINTSECDKCKHCEIDAETIAKIMVYCKAKKKKYHFGQYVPCDLMERKSKDED